MEEVKKKSSIKFRRSLMHNREIKRCDDRNDLNYNEKKFEIMNAKLTRFGDMSLLERRSNESFVVNGILCQRLAVLQNLAKMYEC